MNDALHFAVGGLFIGFVIGFILGLITER